MRATCAGPADGAVRVGPTRASVQRCGGVFRGGAALPEGRNALLELDADTARGVQERDVWRGQRRGSQVS